MRIAVVDDESMFCMQLQMMVKKISQERELPFTVETFSSGDKFISALSSTRYDIVFMDIFMPGMDGIETAQKLRRMTERTFLIFMTASDDHYPDAFALHAFDYVVKPLTIERIGQVLDEIIQHTPMDEAFIKVSVGSIEKKIYLRDIVSVTTDGHYLDIHVEDGEDVRPRMTASEFTSLSGEDARFITINRGIIINMDCIAETSATDVVLTDDSTYPMSSKKAASILQQIHEYQFRTK